MMRGGGSATNDAEKINDDASIGVLYNIMHEQMTRATTSVLVGPAG
jgi:hypothetical protein